MSGIEIDLILVMGSKLTRFVLGIEIDLVLMWASKLCCLSGVEIDVVVFGPIIVRFSYIDRN